MAKKLTLRGEQETELNPLRTNVIRVLSGFIAASHQAAQSLAENQIDAMLNLEGATLEILEVAGMIMERIGNSSSRDLKPITERLIQISSQDSNGSSYCVGIIKNAVESLGCLQLGTWDQLLLETIDSGDNVADTPHQTSNEYAAPEIASPEQITDCMDAAVIITCCKVINLLGLVGKPSKILRGMELPEIDANLATLDKYPTPSYNAHVEYKRIKKVIALLDSLNIQEDGACFVDTFVNRYVIPFETDLRAFQHLASTWHAIPGNTDHFKNISDLHPALPVTNERKYDGLFSEYVSIMLLIEMAIDNWEEYQSRLRDGVSLGIIPNDPIFRVFPEWVKDPSD